MTPIHGPRKKTATQSRSTGLRADLSKGSRMMITIFLNTFSNYAASTIAAENARIEKNSNSADREKMSTTSLHVFDDGNAPRLAIFCRGEQGRVYIVASLIVCFYKIRQSKLGGCPNRSSQALTNRLAVNFDSAIVIAVADVLQQVRHFWKRAPFSIIGKVLFPFPTGLWNVRSGFHSSKVSGYKGGIQRKNSRICGSVIH